MVSALRSFFRQDGEQLRTVALVVAMAGLFTVSCFVLTPYMIAAMFAYLCMLMGVAVRRERRAHAVLMAIAIGTDLAIVLALEARRHAIKTALSLTLSPLQQAHVGASTAATVLYLPIVALGAWHLLGKGGAGSRAWHRRLGIAAFLFRTLGFILMFSLLWRKS